jgi:S1-C subfamily serine protease
MSSAWRRACAFGSVCGALLVGCAAHAPAQRAEVTAARPEPIRSLARISYAPQPGDQPTALGSGVTVDSTGLVLTAFHVVGRRHLEALRLGREARFEVAFADSAKQSPTRDHRARVIRLDASLDLALLQVDEDDPSKRVDFVAVPVGVVPASLGAPVIALGFPGPFTTPQLGRGSIVGFTPSATGGLSWLRSDAWFSAGMSGGPLLDAEGKLIGIALGHVDAVGMPPLRVARPVDRVLPTWTREARAGLASASATLEPYLLRVGAPRTGVLVGDLELNGSETVSLFTEPGRRGVVRVEPASATLTVRNAHGEAVRSSKGAVEIIAEEDPLTWIGIDVPTGGKPTSWRATFEPDARGPQPLPTADLELIIETPKDGTHRGRVMLAPIAIDTALLTNDWIAGRKSEADLVAADVFATTYDGPARIRVPQLVRGGIYSLYVRPDTGTALQRQLRIYGQAKQVETLRLPFSAER